MVSSNCKNHKKTNMEYKTLNNGISMPMVGLGVYNISERKTQKVVEEAIATGYRSIDTAAYYDNEQGVGDAVRACGVPRESLFITTKICDSCYTHDQTFRSIDHSMKELGLDYVDLMLLHWPMGNPKVMWQTLERLYKRGVFRAIGVSNFYPNTFSWIAEGAEVMPVVNQCETHVLYQQRKMMEYLSGLGGMEPAGRGQARHCQEQDTRHHRREIRKDCRTNSPSVPRSERGHHHPEDHPP